MSHKTFEELGRKIKDMESIIPLGSRWIHFIDKKEEHPYLVLNLALEEASEEVVVIYRREDLPESFIWTRPVKGEKGWLSKTEVNGKKVERFKKVIEIFNQLQTK